jgi:hypothetical protein
MLIPANDNNDLTFADLLKAFRLQERYNYAHRYKS